MADKEPVIVIKKITVAAPAAHGGSWKVAFADFMTAMMAFFLVMWLISQSEEVKENVSDYFSTPSVIEYNFSNYGVELTLEKLFLDLMNEPLSIFETYIKPMDHTPNIMALGTKRIVLYHLADQLGDFKAKVEVHENEISFEIESHYLFDRGTARPSSNFVAAMDKIKGLTQGLEDSMVYIDSKMFDRSVVSGKKEQARLVSNKRLDIVSDVIERGAENGSVDIFGRSEVKPYTKDLPTGTLAPGKFRFKIEQKSLKSDGTKTRGFSGKFTGKDEELSVYENFVHQVSGRKAELKKNKKKSKSVH